jgi:hypothetical protein
MPRVPSPEQYWSGEFKYITQVLQFSSYETSTKYGIARRARLTPSMAKAANANG